MNIINNPNINLNIQSEKKLKIKKLKLPRRAKVKRGKIKKGWVGILKINENGSISGEKTKIDDSTYKTKDGTYHATDGTEKLYWNGKFPIFVQEANKLNPTNFFKGKNETYGQDYILARMLKDTIKTKGKFNGGIIIWIVVAIAGFFLAKYIFKF